MGKDKKISKAVPKIQDFPYLANAEFIQTCAQHYRANEVNLAISPNDIFYNEWYMAVGYSAVDCILRGLCAARASLVRRVLDLPCGHGRVLRHLATMFPDSEIDACDLDPDAVAFCSETFNVNGILSHSDLTQAVLPGDYDLIWVGSLFTHLPRAVTQKWLAHITTLLSPTGVVIATTHGRWCEHVYDKAKYISEDKWAVILSGLHERGHGYADYASAENHEYIDAGYGIALTLPHITIKDIEAIPSVRLFAYMERGWSDHHDVVVFGRPGFDTPWLSV